MHVCQILMPLTAPHIKTVMEHVAWLACLGAAASATAGLRSAATLSELADELYSEWSLRRKGPHADAP